MTRAEIERHIAECEKQRELLPHDARYDSERILIANRIGTLHERLSHMEDLYMRRHFQPEYKMPSWVAFCIATGCILFTVACALQYFDVLFEGAL